MATNFDRFLAQILAPVAPQIQQATRGMDPRVAQQVAQMAIQDGVQGVNRFDQGNSMAQYEAALGPDAASLMASAGPVAGATPVPAQQAAIPVQRWTPGQPVMQPGQPVPNPNQAYVPPSDPQAMPVQGPPAPMPQVGRTTEEYVPSGTPLTEDEGFVAVEIMVEGPNGSLEPLRIMVPEHYVADGAPEGVTVFGDGQATPGTAIPDEFKLENQDEAIRWKFTDERDAAIIEQRDTPGSDLAIQEQRNFDAEPTAASLTPEQAAQRQAGSQGATLPQGPEPEVPTYSIDELADQELANKLRSQGITQIREDQFPLTDPQTGQVRLATEQEIIDENLPVPVEWIPAFAEDEAFLQQIKDAGITHIRADQMIVMDNGALKLADAPETSNRELPGTPLPEITPEYLEQYDAGVANEMRQAGITEIPDGMALTRRDGRLQVLPAHTVDADDVIFYGGMSNRPDPGILRDSDGSFNIAGGLQDMIGTGIGALTGVANLGLGVLGNMTGRDLRINDEDVGTALQSIDDATRGQVATDVGNMVYEVTTGNDVDRRGWDWLNERLDFLNTRSTGPYGDMIAFYRERPELAEQLFTEGYDVDGDGVADFVGGRALWEYHVGNEQNMADRILGEIIMDPLNAVSLGAGGVTRTGLGLLRSGTRGGQLVGRPLYGVGRALQWIDEAPGRALLSPVRAVTNRPVRATNVPRRFGDSRVPDYIPEGSLQRGEFTGPIGRLLNPTNETRIARETEPYTEIVGDVTGSARGQSARMGIDPDDPLGGTPLGRARGPQGPTGPGMPGLDRLPQPIRDTLRTSDRAIYDRVVDGRLRPSQVLDADLLNNTGADGVLLPLNATQMARMTPGQIAVYEGLRLEQLRALDAMAPGSTAALERAEAQRRLDELLGEPEDAGPLLDAYGRPLGEEASMDLIEVRQQQRRPSRTQEASDAARTEMLDDRAARAEAERRLDELLATTPDTPSDGLILPGTRGAAARRGIGVEPEAGPVPPRQAELAPTETQGTISAEAAPDTTPRQAELTPQQRDNVIREDEVVRQAEPEAAPTQIDTTGPDLPTDPGDGIPSPTPRDWGNFAPREGGDYLISRLWATRNEYPGRWRAFFDDVNARLREHTQRRGVSNQRSRQIREAAEADRQARLARGEDVSQAPARDFEGAAIDAVDDAEVLLEVYDAARRHYGDVADIRHTFANEYRTTTSRRGRQTNWYGQTDAYYIERAIFGSGRQSQAAFEQLRYKALEQGNTALQAELPRIERLRRQWEQSQGQQTLGLGRPEVREPEVTTPTTRDTGMIASDEFEMGVVPVDSIRTTRGMSADEMRSAGLPVQDFQNRTQDYAERTVADMVNNYQSASMRPIQVVRGTDNNLYVLDGHSRLEAFRRMGRTDIPVQVVEGAPEEIARAADIANVVGTANTPIDQGRIAQRRIDAGESPSEVASAMKLSRREMDNMLALRHLDPESELGRAVDAGQLDVARAAPLGRAIGDNRLTVAEADAFYRSVVVPNDLTARAITDEVSALYKFKIDEGGEGNTLFDLSGTESDAFWQARSRAAEVRKEIARLRRERAKYNSIEKRDGLSQRQKQSRRELDERIAELGNDEVAAESAARDAFYGDPVDTTPSMPEIDGVALLRPMTEADATARRAALDQEGLDLGEAGRPQMQGGRTGTPGEALAPDDILTPQERSAADVMRESGARGLFDDVTPDAERGVGRVGADTLPDRIDVSQQVSDVMRAATPADVRRLVADDVADIVSQRGITNPLDIQDVAELYAGAVDTALAEYQRGLSRIQEGPYGARRLQDAPVRQYGQNDLRRVLTDALGDEPIPPRMEAYLDRLQESFDANRATPTPDYPLNTRGAGHRHLKNWLGTDPQTAPFTPDMQDKIVSGQRRAAAMGENVSAKAADEIRQYQQWWEDRARIGGETPPVVTDAVPSGSSLGIVRDPRREAGEMAEATRRGAQRVRDWWNEPVDGPMDPETRRTRSLLQTGDQLQDRNRDFIATDYRVSLTHDELVTLGRRIGTEPDSPTALQLWERYRDEAQANGADALEALEQGGMRMLQDVYADAMRKADPKKYAVYREAFDQYMEKKDADVTAAHIAAIKDANADVRRVPEGYDTYLAVQREIRLYNPITGSRYIMTQAVGNSITAILGAGLVRGGAITRDMLAETGRDVAAYIRGQNRGAIADLRGGKDLRDFYETPSGGDIRRWAQEEDAAAPGVILDATDVRNIQRGFFENPTVLRVPREEGMGLRETGEMSQETMTRRWMESHRWTKPFSRGSGLLASERVRTVANAFDLSARKVTFDHQMAGMEAAMRPHFYEHAKAALPDGADTARFDQVWSELPATFSDNHLRNALSEFGEGYAERIGRDWRSTQNAMRKEANAEVNRLFFSGQETNLDRALRRVIMFHYWMSRATPLYTASLMKHVGLMENYFQMMHELQEQSEPYGKAVKGMLKLFSTTLGYNIFIRPDAMLQTVMALGGYEGGFDPENESGLVRFMRESGLMFNPFIMSALNYAGLSGDTFAPDPFSLHTHSAFAVAGIDFLKSVLPGIDTPTRNIYQEFNSWLRSETSEAAGVITGRDAIPFQRSDQFGQIEINNLIVDIALDERGMDWNDPQDQALIIAAMNDPESDLYQAAFDRYAQANFTQQVLRIAPTSILYPKMRSAGKDERSLTIRTTERSDPANQVARDQRDYAQITDPDVRTLRVQQDEYQRIGSEEARDAYSTYNAIRFGPLQTPVVYNGVALSEGRLRLMDGDERKAIADAWAEQTGVSEQIEDIREQRKTYREQHPEYARYYDWQITVSDAEGGPTRYWQQLIKDNDNARRYYEGLQETESGDLDRRLTSVEAYLAAEGLRPTGYDPDPLDTGSGNPATMLSDYGLGAPGGYPPYEPVDPATRIREDLAEYYSQADAVDAQIKAIYGPDASLEKIMNANPMWRQGYLDRLAREGIEVPKLSKASQDYIAWAEAQPDGADTSVDAYVAWLDANETETTVTPEEAEERVRMGIGR